jgi:zinc protease
MMNRQKAPEILPLKLGKLIEPVQHDKSIYLFPRTDLNVFRLDLIFPKAGTGNSPIFKSNVVTGEMLFSGTASYTAQQIHHMFDSKGAYLNVETTYSKSVLTIYGLSRYMDYCNQILLELLSDPVFPENELNILKSQKIQQLETRKKKTGYQTKLRLNERYFGASHPLGRVTNEQDYATVSRETLLETYQENFSSGILIMTGNIQKECLDLWKNAPLLNSDDQYFEYNEVNQNPVDLSLEEGVEMSESNQASVATRTPIVDRLHPDYFPLIVFNLILGGYFGSRIMKNIREEKGLTYGMGSSIQKIGNQTFMQIAGDVKGDCVTLVFEELEKEIIRLQNEEVGSDEWKTALNYYIGNLQNSFDNFMGYPVKLINLLETGCNMNWYHEAIEKISKVNPSDVKRVANTYFSKESLIKAWAGPKIK